MKYIGFYWTYPVRWAGFTEVPEDPEEAAIRSLTIRYQLELAKQWAKENKGELIGGFAFVEVEPRPTGHIKDVLKKAIMACGRHQARLIHVDFPLEGGWRMHQGIRYYINEAGVDAEAILPKEIIFSDGTKFNPVNHFRNWHEQTKREAAIRRNRASQQLEELNAICPFSRGRYQLIATELNRRGVLTLHGKRVWTADNVKKALAKARHKQLTS